MRITSIYKRYFQLMRAKEVLFIVVKHAFKDWFSHGRSRKRRVGAQRQVYTTQERLRITIEELGPTYIKFGQILADRPDMISEALRKELKKLQSSAQPMKDELAIELIENELGCAIDELFNNFDRRCLASASIGQVYQAELKTGEKVIVKIQRPHIENKIKLDLYLMHYLARRTSQSYPELAAVNIVGLIEEFGAGIMMELDYHNEASNIMRFNEMFKAEEAIKVPKVYMELCSKRLLVMEKIEGYAPDDPELLRSAGLDPNVVAVNGANALLKMILEHGFFHADPHPGNIFVMENNVVAFIDYGMTGTLKPREMNFLADFCLGFAKGDAKSLANALLSLCGIKYFDRVDELEFELSELIKRNSYIPFEKMDFANIIQECVNMIVRYRLQIPSGIFMLVKALATIQKFAVKLAPDLSLGPIIMPYARQIVMHKYHPRRIAGAIYDTIKSYVNLAQTLPDDVGEILYKVKIGKVNHDISIHDGEKIIKRFGRIIGIVALVCSTFLGSIALVIWSNQKVFGEFLLFASTIMLFILLLKLMFRTRL